MSRGRCWLVAGGGTGGHVTMALALGEQIAARDERVLFLGSEQGLEGRLVPEAGFELETLPSRQVMGRSALARLGAIAGLGTSTLRALALFRRVRPDVVVSVGGYAAVPAVAAAALRRRPVAVVEPNAVPGRTNRLTGRLARRVFVGFESAVAAFPRADRVRWSGIPVRRAVVDAMTSARRAASPPFRLFVFGGSQGARQINEALMDALPRLDPGRFEVVHQTGEADRARVAEAYAAAGVRAEVFAFDVDMARHYRWADLAVCRAGAISCAELLLAGLPALLVPYPYAADDHQRANARELEAAGAARCLDPGSFDGKTLADALQALVGDLETLTAMSARARERARPDAARRIVDELAEMLDAAEAS